MSRGPTICMECGASVVNAELHITWHREQDRLQEPAWEIRPGRLVMGDAITTPTRNVRSLVDAARLGLDQCRTVEDYRDVLVWLVQAATGTLRLRG